MINSDDPLDVQVTKQAKIIEALIRRAGRRQELSDTAYGAFQSAIVLQEQVWAKTRDLELVANELELLRFDRERAQKSLSDALSAMEGGFALFTEGELQICNDLFKSLLPDITDRILPGLTVENYFNAVETSRYFVGEDEKKLENLTEALRGSSNTMRMSIVMEIKGDRWFQISQQRTSSDNIIILQTEITDIVRKNRLEKDQLIDMQAHYLQAAFDHMSLGICTFSRDGSEMIHNEQFCELLGLPITLVQTGTSFAQILRYIKDSNLMSEKDLQDATDDWLQELRNEGRLRKRLRYRNGRVLDLHVHRLPDNGFLADVKDVTLESRTTELLEKRVEERTFALTETNRRLTNQYDEQARVEEELRLAKEEAEAVLSSKTRFLAAASHDLLQPINAAKLLISTLKDVSTETKQKDLVERLDGSFSSMESLLRALLDISRLESTGSELEPTEFCLGTLMQTVIADQKPIAEEKGVQLDIVPSSVWVRSDQRYLLRSIQNLVVNAIQYTDKGRILVGCRRRGEKVEIQVWDTGIGIAPKDQKRVFEEFTRADNVPPGSGMGLGLSIVDQTCRHLGHKLAVRSLLGVGSVFSIEMDVVPERQLDIVPEIEPHYSPDGDMNLIVLVIDNDPDALFAMVQKLEYWGASVLAAASTEQALEMVRDLGLPPDIILADCHLDGDDNGIHTIQAIREETAEHVPAIMITADRGSALVNTGVENDFTVLTKPLQLWRLRPLIDWKTRRIRSGATDKSIA